VSKFVHPIRDRTDSDLSLQSKMPGSTDPTRFLPLRPVELLILTVLGSGDRHGYAIRKQVLESTQGRVSIEAGNLYRYIRSLEDDGLVVDAPTRSADADERRIYYRLTPLGRRVLAAELERLRALVRYAEAEGLIARFRA
jgi:PadR family transcriptional regulator